MTTRERMRNDNSGARGGGDDDDGQGESLDQVRSSVARMVASGRQIQNDLLADGRGQAHLQHNIQASGQ